jgi:methionyl-tRNA formyltransferase
LPALKEGRIAPREQNDAEATLAPILKKEDGLIDFQRTATEIWNRLRGFQPWPGAYTTFRGKHLSIVNAKPHSINRELNGSPGELALDGEQLLVWCGQSTSLELLEVQPEGKKKMVVRDFLNGYRPTTGEKLGV